MFKKIITDWSLWVLIIFNLYLLDYYQQHPTEIGTLIFMYWAQSVLIGVINVFEILTTKVKPGTFTINNKPVGENGEGKGCVALFFIMHYGIFHFVYLIFILVKMFHSINLHFVLIGLGILAASMVLDFVMRKIQHQGKEMNIGTIFFLPYARIVPMHFMILLPEFLHISNFTVFIILKIVMDLLMHFITSSHYRGGNSAAPLSSES